MQLACTLSTYPTKFGPIVFKDGNLEKNFALMNKYGYRGVDLFVNSTSKDTMKEYKNMLEANNLSVATYLAIFLAENGVKLSEKDSAKRQRNLKMVKEQLENAKYFNARGLAMGFIRGGYDEGDEQREDGLKRIAEALFELGEYAQSIGTSILLEPINRYEINTINTVIEGVDFIKSNHLKGIGLLLDTFHMNIEDKSFYDSIQYSKGYATNIHIADSNRYALGEGHLNLDQVLCGLRDIDFDGYLTLEAFVDNPEDALRKTREQVQAAATRVGIDIDF